MCYLLFLAADRELTITPFDRAKPAFHVIAIDEREQAVRAHLSKPHVYCIGSHTGCACGFQFGDPSEDQDKVAQSRRELAPCVAEVARYGDVELYCGWEGELEQPLLGTSVATPAQLADPEFTLAERHLLRIAQIGE